VVVDLIQVSVRQKRSGWCVSIISDKAAECRGWRIERILRVHRQKLLGPGLSSISYIKNNSAWKTRLGKWENHFNRLDSNGLHFIWRIYVLKHSSACRVIVEHIQKSYIFFKILFPKYYTPCPEKAPYTIVWNITLVFLVDF